MCEHECPGMRARPRSARVGTARPRTIASPERPRPKPGGRLGPRSRGIAFICTTCGVQYAERAEPPASCLICADERQFVNPRGQTWTTPDALRRSHRNVLRAEEPGLTGIGMEPSFGIGQRALLVRTREGNVLWDCVPLLDPAVVDAVQAVGGLAAIAISHPHFYAAMADWSHAFGRVPVYLHAADRQYVMRPDPVFQFWEGDHRQLAGGLTLVCCGGHFEGSTLLHWPEGAEGRGVLLTGDTIQAVPNRRTVSFMFSYPNYIPLPAEAVQRIAAAVEPFVFDRIYGGWFDRMVPAGAKAIVARSAARYLRAIGSKTVSAT
jgi:glyoxylase-like metal-dependent hydrolase (beta-lactamase superfamily II)